MKEFNIYRNPIITNVLNFMNIGFAVISKNVH